MQALAPWQREGIERAIIFLQERKIGTYFQQLRRPEEAFIDLYSRSGKRPKRGNGVGQMRSMCAALFRMKPSPIGKYII